MTLSKKITVLLPVYNGARFLEEAIISILDQTFSGFDLLIIDDASTDGTEDIVKSFRDSRIKYFKNDKNIGLINTLNRGLKMIHGDYIARMDHDDICFPNRLELQYNFMEEYNLDICGGDYVSIDANGSVLTENFVPKNLDEITVTLASNVPFAHPSVMIKNSFLREKNLWYGVNGLCKAEDLDLWMIMYENKARFGNLSEFILKYRVIENSLSKRNHKIIKKESNALFDRYVKNNWSAITASLKRLVDQKVITDRLQRNIILTILRYSTVSGQFGILFFYILKLKFTNVVWGCFSFVKLKFP